MKVGISFRLTSKESHHPREIRNQDRHNHTEQGQTGPLNRDSEPLPSHPRRDHDRSIVDAGDAVSTKDDHGDVEAEDGFEGEVELRENGREVGR